MFSLKKHKLWKMKYQAVTWGSIRHSCSWPHMTKSRKRGKKCSLMALLGFVFILYDSMSSGVNLLFSTQDEGPKINERTIFLCCFYLLYAMCIPVLMKNQYIEPVRHWLSILSSRPHPLYWMRCLKYWDTKYDICNKKKPAYRFFKVIHNLIQMHLKHSI